MKRLYLYLLTSITLTAGSCNFLDVTPEHQLAPENYFNTEAELLRGLVGVYDVLGSTNTYGNYMLGRMGLDADQGFYSRNELTGVAVYDAYPTDILIRDVWRTFYDGINRANFLLENIDKPDIAENRRDVIKGEAKFLRAFYYFILVSNYGPVPLKTETNKSPEDILIPRTPAKEVYDFIVKEMEEAEALVPAAATVGFGGRVSKSAVRGVLARVCLFMAGHPINEHAKMAEARNWAKMVMDYTTEGGFRHELNPSFSQVFINYAQDLYDIKESIWEIEFWGYPDGTYTESKRVGSNNGIRAHHASDVLNDAIGYAYGHILATPDLFQLYPDRERVEHCRDTRRDWTIAPFWYGSTHTSATKVYWQNTAFSEIYRRYAGKWRREYEVVRPKSTNDTPQNYPLLRFSDVLLMFAEAENELNGPTPEAFEALNQVKRRAYGVDQYIPGQLDMYGDPIDVQGLSAEQLRNYIRDERSRELAYENLRKGDLVRWGIFYTRMKEAEFDMVNFGPTTFQPHSRYFQNVMPRDERWPIPAREIGLNTALTQNPGW